MAVFTLCSCGEEQKPTNEHNDPETEVKVYTGKELTSAMGVGWNLGNTLDAPDGENSWGQPTTTKEMIDKIHELGFNTIRIPTSWGKHNSGAPDYSIDKDWMDRVQTIVDWAIDNDMFVILNSHHDNDYYYPSKEHSDQSVEYITAIWTQVAERFKDYDQHLIFESMNEPRLSGTANEWWFDSNNAACLEAAEVINKCNQACVDIVRACGGGNTDRFIMVTPYSASLGCATSEQFELPDDPSNKLLISVHSYNPYNLALNGDMAYKTFGDNEKREIDNLMNALYENFIKNDIYVVIGETGCTNKGNMLSRKEWAEYSVAAGIEKNIPSVFWDNGGTGEGSENFGIFDRRNLEIFEVSRPYYEGIMAGLK